jgi:leader peptidase (prepilin peptidase)/N-methyltransferase
VVLAALLGLAVGSHLNVVAYRLPLGRSLVRPGSACPRCGTPIRALDNLPVVGWLLLRGRCRSCGEPIALRYPLIEAVTGILFVLVMLRYGPTIDLVGGWILAALLVALTAIDVEHFLLPDALTWGGIVAGLAVRAAVGIELTARGEPGAAAGRPLLHGVLGAALGAGILLALIYGWYLVRREWGMGLGDVKMLAMIGAFLGWRGTVVALFVAALGGALVGIALLAGQRAGLKTKLPFGAFLGLGGVVALLVGDRLVAAYTRLL